MTRAAYMRELRGRIEAIVVGQDRISLAWVERELGSAWADRMPGRVTLAKAVAGLGWTKVPRPGSGAIYQRPSQAKRPWTPDEDDRLREMVAVGLSSDFWSSAFPDRSFGEIAERRLELNSKMAELI